MELSERNSEFGTRSWKLVTRRLNFNIMEFDNIKN